MIPHLSNWSIDMSPANNRLRRMSDVYALHESLGYLLSVAARNQERNIETAMKKLGLTRTGWCVLLAIGHEGLSKPSEIASYVLIDRTAASRALRQLEAAGMIGRQSGKQDRRTTEVELTAKGRETLKTAVSVARVSDASTHSLFTDSEHREIRRMLRKLAIEFAEPPTVTDPSPMP